MTYIVKDECIKCKLTDCVDVFLTVTIFKLSWVGVENMIWVKFAVTVILENRECKYYFVKEETLKIAFIPYKLCVTCQINLSKS